MNASIRPSLSLILLLLAACTPSTRGDATVPRPVREPMVLLEEGVVRTSAQTMSREVRAREPKRSNVVWRVNAVR